MAAHKKLTTIYKTNDRGTYVLDWRRPEIGRIRRATGIENNLQMVRKLRTMMDNLYENGRLDVLRDIKNGVIRPLEAYEFWRTQELEQIPSVATLRPIKPTIPDWIEKHDVADSTRKGYRDHFKQFVNIVSGEVRLLDLPKALKKYRDHCVQNQTLRAFNYTRSILQAYLNHTFGRHHALWQQVSHIKPLRIKKQNQAPQLSVVEVVELIRQLPKAHADIVRTMVSTGMGWSEVTGDWSVESDRVVIKGTKTKGRDRIVPKIDPDISKPQRATKAFRTQLKNVRPDISPYSFRRSFAHWMEEAQIPRIRRVMYLGHGNTDPGVSWEESAEIVFDRLDVSQTTRLQYRREIRPFLRFMRHRGGMLTPTILLDWKRRLERRTDIGTGTKKKYLNVARVLLRELHRWHPDRIPDLVTGVRGFRVNQIHKRNPITDEDLSRVWDFLYSEADLRLMTIFGLLYYQGFRRVELSRLLVEDFKRESKMLLVHGKGRDDKEPVDLHPRMVEILVAYLDQYALRSGPLFPSRRRLGLGLSTNMLWRLVMNVHKQLDIRKNVHSYRKVFTSKLIESGMNLLEVRQYTRHRDVTQLQVYYDRLDKKKTLPTYYTAFG